MRKLEKRKNADLLEPEFVRDSEGAELARISIGAFRKLADEFGCVYKVGRTRLTNWLEFKNGLENYRKNRGD